MLKIKKINFSDILVNDNLRLSFTFNYLFNKFDKEYIELVNSTNEKEKLSNLIEIKKPNNIKKGDLLIYTTVFDDLRIWFAEKKDIDNFKENKGVQSINKIIFKNNKIDGKYLLGFFDNQDVKNYLSLYFTGNYGFKHISKKYVYNLQIPLKSKKIKLGVSSLEITDISAHNDILSLLIKEYKKAKKLDLEISTIVLMGAIVENILLQELIKNNVKKGYLNKFQGINQLLNLAKIEEIFIDTLKINKEKDEKEKVKITKNEKDYEKNISGLFSYVANARNLLHPKKHLEQIENKSNIIKNAINSFDEIIKEFNIII